MKKWFTINAKAEEPTEILIYDQIGKDWFTNDGVGAKEFAEALADIPRDKKIIVGINSPGGNVWDGLAIYHQLKLRAANVTTRIDGVAASIASVIALAGSKVVMPKNALMMIHRAWGMAVGNAADMLKLADDLVKHDEVIAGIYSVKNGKPAQENLKAMEDETWFNGTEASAFGLVDEVSDVVAIAASFSFEQFKNFKGFPAKEAEKGAVQPASPEPQQKNKTMSNTPNKAESSNPAPVNDLAPVIAAINALGDKLNAATSPQPGAAPVAVRVENLGNPLVERYNGLAHDKVEQSKLAKGLYGEVRKQLMIANGVTIASGTDRFDFSNPQVMNANTVDSALANTILSGDFISVMRSYIAPWSAFTRRVELSPVSRRQTLEVPLVSSSGSKQQNATNYESGDSVFAPVAVTVAEESKSFHVSRPEQNLGLQLAALVPTNARVLAEGIHTKMTALMIAANFGTATTVGTAANFDSADLPAILALGKNYNQVRLLLDGGHLAYLLPTSRESFTFGEPGAYGFDGGIYKNNLWTSGIANLCGFVCGPDAIVNAWGLADGLPSGEAISQSTVDVNGIPFGLSVWFSRSSRSVWASFQVMHGCAVGDGSQAELLVTA